MKKISMFLFAVMISAAAQAQYQTFTKEVNWGVSKNSVQSSRNNEFKKVIDIKSATTMRFLFSETRLGKGNYLKIEFPYDQKPLHMNDRIIKGFGNGTPYLKGGKFRISLVLKNKAAFKGLNIESIEATRIAEGGLSSRTICDTVDDRVASDEKRMGRMMRDIKGNGGCSGGMISETCLLTAGHCMSTTGIVEFQVPQSSKKGSPVPAAPEDQYAKTEVIDHRNDGAGSDWAVIRYGKNPITDKYPGEVQGAYKVFTGELQEEDTLRITGFGTDSERHLSQTQQTNTGNLVKFEKALQYRVDTTPGNSGTPVVLESMDQIIGIHTHGGCHSNGGANKGTSIHFSERFQKAIKACLAAERKELRNRK